MGHIFFLAIYGIVVLLVLKVATNKRKAPVNIGIDFVTFSIALIIFLLNSMAYFLYLGWVVGAVMVVVAIMLLPLIITERK